MTIVEKYNGLNRQVVTRRTLERIAAIAEEEDQKEIYTKISAVLDSNEDSSFKINIKKPISTGLNAARHSGEAKEALNECGRLKKGYRYDKTGKIVKVAARKKKPAAKKKSVAKPSARKKTRLDSEKEKLKKKVLGLKQLLTAGNLPNITKGLNGYLADGHEILTEEELELYGPEEWEGLNAAAKDVESIVNELILEKIKTGEELPPWKQSWATKADIPAQNFITKKPYTGSNSTILNVILGSVMPTPYYVTFNQVKTLKGKVKEGAKSIPLVYYNFVYTLKNFSDNPGKEAALLSKINGRKIKR